MKISIQGLTKKYGDFKAVDSLTLDIESGELVGLLGPSGCGKSTTLFMLSGLTDPTEGTILFGDTDVTRIPPEDREIGLVFQNYALYPHMSVLDNIMFPLINRKVPKKEAKERAEAMAKVVHLEGLLGRKPKALSGGQQQRVAIARALVKEPQVLLLDEPLSNLDAKLRVETREEIRRIQQEVKITTIFVTHDQEEAMSISDRIAVMDAGVLQQFEKPQDMYLNPVNTFVANFLGTPQINMFDGEVTDKGVFLGGNLLRAREDFADKSKEIPNGTYKMGIRPEHFELCDDGVPATADRVLMTGRELQVFFTLGETPFRLLTHSDQRLSQGSEFNLRVRASQLMIFSEDNLTLAKV
ncbi:MAG: ABC transporter ATP-binding protein [Oscillospiraceae bacterium]|nr:ABC transporter ATP-binding protein [Oscillospiraceae bacterium]